MADEILAMCKNTADIKLCAEFHADRVRYHEGKTEYIFKDETVIFL